MRLIIFYLLLSLPALSYGGNRDILEESHPVYYGKDYFLVEGTDVPENLKENIYDRLPASLKTKVREPVWELSKNSAGLSVRFFSNSTSVKVRWKLLLNKTMNHMAETGIKGLDLYVKTAPGKWRYVNTARPSGLENEFLLVNNMSETLREYRIYLPLYDGVESLLIGIDSAAIIKKPLPGKQKPVIFYGTSITQGGCASRPGMVYTSIISRKLNTACINYGFSANGRMEKPIVELISGTDALFYVIDCSPNMTAEQISTNAIPLVTTIRKKRPSTPIIFIENQLYDKAFLDTVLMQDLVRKNRVLKQMVDSLSAGGHKNIFYIKGENALGADHEGTVDGIHFTDLGFMRYAGYLIRKFIEFGLIPEVE